jgi:hypothetical protein
MVLILVLNLAKKRLVSWSQLSCQFKKKRVLVQFQIIRNLNPISKLVNWVLSQHLYIPGIKIDIVVVLFEVPTRQELAWGWYITSCPLKRKGIGMRLVLLQVIPIFWVLLIPGPATIECDFFFPSINYGSWHKCEVNLMVSSIQSSIAMQGLLCQMLH